jgi:hypothetical protein
MLFLEDLPLTGVSSNPTGVEMGALMGAFIGIFIVALLIFFALYLYLSIVYSRIGKKAGLTNPGIAWMPGFGSLAVIFESSKMHWWPFLMLTIVMTSMYPLSFFLLINSSIVLIISIISFVFMAIFGIMTIVWHWKTYEAVGKPGWWILVPLICWAVGIGLFFLVAIIKSSLIVTLSVLIMIFGAIIHLILLGVAAWSKK